MRTVVGAFPFDASMPGLPRAADGAAMCRLLEQHVRRAWPPWVVIEDCRVTRIRYRRHTRCFLQYELTLRDGGVSRRAWVTGSLYANPRRAERLAGRLPDAGFIPELRMLVSVFPVDHKLPQAAAIMAGRDAQLRETVIRACGGLDWRVDSWVSEPVRYREHLSLVARYTVRASSRRTGETAERVFYVKGYPNRATARGMFAHGEALARHAARSSMGVSIQPPLACLDHLHAVLVAATNGRPLSDIVAFGGRAETAAAARDAARAMARFNLSDAPMTRKYRASDYVQSLARTARILEWACPPLSCDLCGVFATVARHAADTELMPTHRDMKPEHVLLGASQPTFIDLDSCAAADPVLDPALMLARFAGLATTTGAAPHVCEVASAYADEYFRIVPASWRGRLSLYYAGSLLEVAADLFHRQEPGWRDRIVPLVGAAKRAARRFNRQLVTQARHFSVRQAS